MVHSSLSMSPEHYGEELGFADNTTPISHMVACPRRGRTSRLYAPVAFPQGAATAPSLHYSKGSEEPSTGRKGETVRGGFTQEV